MEFRCGAVNDMSKKTRGNSPLWQLQTHAMIRADKRARSENLLRARANWFRGGLSLAGFVIGALVGLRVDGSWNTMLVSGAAGVSLGMLVHLLIHGLFTDRRP